MCSIQVHVDLGGGDAFVAQHLLNGPEVGPMFQEMGGEGMSEGVRADLLTDPALFGQLFYQGEDHGPGEAGPATVEEQDILKSFLYRCMHPYLIPVDIYVLLRFRRNWHKPLFISFSRNQHKTLRKIQVR